MAPPLHSPALISTTSPSTLRIVSPVPSSPWCRRARPLASAGLGGAARRDWRRRRSTRGRRGMRICAYTAEAEHGSSEEDVADDFYSVLGVMPDATSEEIKKAYYSCMKTCHPDLSGGHPDVTNFSMFINEVYTVLSDPVQRAVYDEIHGYTTTATNPFVDDSAVKNHVFVDEFTCIEFAPTCAPVSLKLRKTLGGQESAPRGVARTSFRMPLIVGENTKATIIFISSVWPANYPHHYIQFLARFSAFRFYFTLPLIIILYSAHVKVVALNCLIFPFPAQLTVFAGLLLHNFHSLRVKHEE